MPPSPVPCVSRRAAANAIHATVLDNGLALWHCWKYIEMNPVRAGLVGDPAEYRFCSFGRWAGTGRDPTGHARIESRLPLPHRRELPADSRTAGLIRLEGALST